MLRKRKLSHKIIGIALCMFMLVSLTPTGGITVTAEDAPAGIANAESVFPVGPSGKSFIHNPTTYCNPITLTEGTGTAITCGEPIIRVFKDDYYLTVRGRTGYWWSHDFKDWTYVSAPNLLGGIPGFVEIDGKLYNYAGNTNNRVMTTDDPKTGVWYSAGTFSSNNYGDASMLYDEETGRLFMYYGWSQILGIRVVELDKKTFKEISKPVVAIWGDPYNHGWEARYAADNIWPYFTYRQYRYQEYGWTEGPHPLKYKGKYYLMYASIGLEFFSYGHGVYVADDPMGPYVYDEHNPLTLKTTGIAPGAGHGSIWVDRQDKVWTVCMMAYPINGGNGHTLINLFPTDVDAEGTMHGKVEYGDYPQYLPGVKEAPIKDNYTGWALLSANKKVEVSSTYSNANRPEFAVDEDSRSYWSAATGNPGEYITVDLGAVSDMRGIQILWDRTATYSASTRYRSYTVEVSSDNENWTTIIDKSNNPQDLPSDYIELPAAVYGRYVKLTNVYRPGSGRFAVKGFRVFGNPETATFKKVDNVKVVRNKADRRFAHLLWDQVDGADGYTVRYGIEPDKLYNSYIVYKDTYKDVPSLNVDPEYYFEVEAFSSGAPLYAVETQGGAELQTNPIIEDNYKKGWVLLSLDKKTEASSAYEASNGQFWPAFAVDEDPNTPNSSWSALTGNPGEYITVDLGEISDVRGMHILFNRAGAFGFTVDVSGDNKNWTTIIDKSDNSESLQSDYFELPTAVKTRYLKLTNTKATPDNARFAVTAFRAFGNPEKATFKKVDNVKVVRSKLDRHNAHLLWDLVDGAEGYVVRYGTEPGKLDKSYRVYWNSYFNITSLDVDSEYYFEVEAFSSGTPRFVENTFETRGRGAELQFSRPGGTAYIMTYETFGRDEVYVFENCTPGNYSLTHRYGVGIWSSTALTAAQLIGTGTEPTYVASNLTTFGIGSTQWGTIEVRVYPGATSGRIEVVLKYDKTPTTVWNPRPTRTISATSSFPNLTDAAVNGKAIMALYDAKGRLVQWDIEEFTVDAMSAGTIRNALKLPDDVTSGYTAKVFFWDDATFTPLCAPTTFVSG